MKELNEEEQMTLIYELEIFNDLKILQKVLKEYCQYAKPNFNTEPLIMAHISGKQDVYAHIEYLKTLKRN